MIRQSSSRNQRSKGVRMKHILQICMLLAVCFWLIYQVKHSNDKRKHFEENEAQLPERLPNHEVLKLGRKDLHPLDEELSTKHEKIGNEELEDEETIDKGEDNFIETQEELERKRKEEGAADIEALIHGEEGAVGRDGDDDDIDEQDQEKGGREADGDEDVIGDIDVEKDEENKNEENDGDEDEHQADIDSSSDDRDGSGANTHEAREEHYKADDASSAVAHVAQTGLTEIPERNNLNSDLHVQEHAGSSNETDVGTENHLNAVNVLEESNEATPKFEDIHVINDTSSGTVDSTLQGEGGQVLETIPDQNNTREGLSDKKSSNTTEESHYIDGTSYPY